MTRTALSIIDGLMLGQRSVLPGDGIAVATAANFLHWCLQQPRFSRGMRGMAVQAPRIVNHGPVNLVFIEGLIHHFIVTALAQFVAIFESRKRGL